MLSYDPRYTFCYLEYQVDVLRMRNSLKDLKATPKKSMCTYIVNRCITVIFPHNFFLKKMKYPTCTAKMLTFSNSIFFVTDYIPYIYENAVTFYVEYGRIKKYPGTEPLLASLPVPYISIFMLLSYLQIYNCTCSACFVTRSEV